MKGKLTFRQWYMGLDPRDKKRYRERIIRACGMSKTSFHGYVLQDRRVSKLVREKIVEIIGFEVEFIEPKKEVA